MANSNNLVLETMRSIDNIVFKTGNDAANYVAGVNTTQMFIDAGESRVGIGTITPSQKLDVNGQIRMRGTSGTAGYIPVSDADGVMTWTDPSTVSTAKDHDWFKEGTTLEPDDIANNIYTEGNVSLDGGNIKLSQTKGDYTHTISSYNNANSL